MLAQQGSLCHGRPLFRKIVRSACRYQVRGVVKPAVHSQPCYCNQPIKSTSTYNYCLPHRTERGRLCKAMAGEQHESFQPLQATKDAICTGAGSRILSGFSKDVFVQHVDTNGIVLGLQTPSGSTAVQDFALGKVCSFTLISAYASLTRFLSVTALLLASVSNLLQLHCCHFVSSSRNKLWWMTPKWGAQAKDICSGVLQCCS